MFEYHGWISVQESADADDSDSDSDHGDVLLARIAEAVEARITEIDSPGLLDLRWMNGELFLHLGGLRNHRDPEVLEFFGEVGRLAPGSYGVMHVRDDEDPGRENEVRVLRMVRGRVHEDVEAALSPCIPVLEEPYPG
ncbi:Imm7 family immunity protein [Streptomyces erythrochromogenes]|uniref:Imm7 family immunity protein n=1 Tax=Streptomyces erythrochromogenes TaxID=285574 RepID=UPI0022538BD2|nr:Imm7 family immunity protein [Streptomyces erythrochromogenes]MCX5582083.1 immunity 7 family protein [Streptomyces erythrochromogenes]